MKRNITIQTYKLTHKTPCMLCDNNADVEIIFQKDNGFRICLCENCLLELTRRLELNLIESILADVDKGNVDGTTEIIKTSVCDKENEQ